MFSIVQRICGAAVLMIAMVVSLTLTDTAVARTGDGQAQRGAGFGGQRARGGFEPEPGRRGDGRRGGRASGTAARIEMRRYLFADTQEYLEYGVFVSTKVKKDRPSPLVIALHGLGVPPALMLRMITDEAEKSGYIVAAPTGYSLQGWYGANGSGGGRGGVPSNLGELSEKDVMNVLELMRKDFNVDQRRIYLAGQSMGGAGALFLGIKHRDIWAAVAASAPAIRAQLHTPDELEQARDMPIILVHGDADPGVPVEQSRAWAAKMKSLNMTFEYHELRGAGHSDAIVEGARPIFAFFNKHVKPAGPANQP